MGLVKTLSIIIECRLSLLKCYSECRYAECHYSKSRQAECHYAKCRQAECRYAECLYAECRSTSYIGDFGSSAEGKISFMNETKQLKICHRPKIEFKKSFKLDSKNVVWVFMKAMAKR